MLDWKGLSVVGSPEVVLPATALVPPVALVCPPHPLMYTWSQSLIRKAVGLMSMVPDSVPMVVCQAMSLRSSKKQVMYCPLPGLA